MESKLLHEVVTTAIIVKDGKYLITKRSAMKPRFPNMWTVPGGKLEVDDYRNLPKDTNIHGPKDHSREYLHPKISRITIDGWFLDYQTQTRDYF